MSRATERDDLSEQEEHDVSVTTRAPQVNAGTPTLAGQVRQLQEHFPDLYNYLKARDRAIERALRQVPSRADIELSATGDPCARLEQAIQSLQPGVAALSGQMAVNDLPEEMDDEDYYGC